MRSRTFYQTSVRSLLVRPKKGIGHYNQNS